eukprot:gene1099-1542_t
MMEIALRACQERLTNKDTFFKYVIILTKVDKATGGKQTKKTMNEIKQQISSLIEMVENNTLMVNEMDEQKDDNSSENDDNNVDDNNDNSNSNNGQSLSADTSKVFHDLKIISTSSTAKEGADE